MDSISLDTVLFSAFLAVSLIIGLRYGRSVKTLRDYSIGNKDFPTAIPMGCYSLKVSDRTYGRAPKQSLCR